MKTALEISRFSLLKLYVNYLHLLANITEVVKDFEKFLAKKEFLK